jgi:hypothetical protein
MGIKVLGVVEGDGREEADIIGVEGEGGMLSLFLGVAISGEEVAAVLAKVGMS